MFKYLKQLKRDQSGSIALEYIMISAFAAVLSIAALGFVNEIIKEKTQKIEEQLGIKFEGIEGGIF